MNRYRVAVFGTSFARLVHAPGFRAHPGFELVALAGSDAEKTRAVAARAGRARRVRGLARAARAREARPRQRSRRRSCLHHPMMLAALAAGAHVLCEKPTAMDRRQAAEMRDAALAAGRDRGHQPRVPLPARARARASSWCAQGAIGRPRRAAILGRYPLWAPPDSRGMTWLSDASAGRRHPRRARLAPHRLPAHDLRRAARRARHACAWTSRAAGRSSPAAAPAPRPPTMRARSQYDFDGGATALVDLSACAPYRWERFEIHGEESTLRWDDTGLALWRIAPGREPEPLEIPARLQLDSRAGRAGAARAVPRDGATASTRRSTRGEPLAPSFAADAVPCRPRSTRRAPRARAGRASRCEPRLSGRWRRLCTARERAGRGGIRHRGEGGVGPSRERSTILRRRCAARPRAGRRGASHFRGGSPWRIGTSSPSSG